MNTRRTVARYGMVDGCSCQCLAQGAGGAGKKCVKTTDAIDEIEVLFAFEVSSDDIQAVKSALTLKSISLKGWVESLNRDDAGA